MLCVWSVLVLLAGCRPPRKLNYVVLSYGEESSYCEGCPHFRVELRQGGYVTLFGLSGCAIPGEYRYRVPAAAFSTLLREFDERRFFSTPRLDTGNIEADALVKRVGYRDEWRIHEVVDAVAHSPALLASKETSGN